MIYLHVTYIRGMEAIEENKRIYDPKKSIALAREREGERERERCTIDKKKIEKLRLALEGENRPIGAG